MVLKDRAQLSINHWLTLEKEEEEKKIMDSYDLLTLELNDSWWSVNLADRSIACSSRACQRLTDQESEAKSLWQVFIFFIFSIINISSNIHEFPFFYLKWMLEMEMLMEEKIKKKMKEGNMKTS